MTDRTTASFCSEIDLLSTARRGFDLVQADPSTAEQLLRGVLDAPADVMARVIALWGCGRLAHDRGAIVEALTVYTEAVTTAVDAGMFELAAEVRISWSVCLQANGM